MADSSDPRSGLAPLIVLSGPSGSGKSTLVDRLLARTDLPLRRSVSATTRPPRPNEQDGKDYYFWSRSRFDQAVSEGTMLEWAEINGQLYGTPRAKVDQVREQGLGVILVIDVQGADQVRRRCSELVSIFLKAPTLDVCRDRLHRRGTESEEDIQRRMARAKAELQRSSDYDHVVINDDLDRTVEKVQQIIGLLFVRSNHAG